MAYSDVKQCGWQCRINGLQQCQAVWLTGQVKWLTAMSGSVVDRAG